VLQARWLGAGFWLVAAFGGELACSDAKRDVPTPDAGVIEPGAAGAERRDRQRRHGRREQRSRPATPTDTNAQSLPAWMHALSDWAWETSPNEGTDCAVAQGSAKSSVAILNHYVPRESASDDTLLAAHARAVVAARLARCNDDRKQLPNFVFVDFAEVGDPNGGVQIANGLR
jgi:hypothetical protein